MRNSAIAAHDWIEHVLISNASNPKVDLPLPMVQESWSWLLRNSYTIERMSLPSTQMVLMGVLALALALALRTVQ